MATKCKDETHYFSQPWKFSDVVLVVEERKFHVHRAVLALSSPVFEKMFTSEFQEKEKKEVPLPDKKASEVEELLLMIYPSAAEKQITEENSSFLVNLAHEYQMEAIVQRCEDFLVEKINGKPKDHILADMVLAQKYELGRLKSACIKQAFNLSLEELKNDKMYDQIGKEDLVDITEGIMLRQEKEIRKFKYQCQKSTDNISKIKRHSKSALKDLEDIASYLLDHLNSRRSRRGQLDFHDVNSSLGALCADVGSDACKCGYSKCGSLDRISKKLRAMKTSLEEIEKIPSNEKIYEEPEVRKQAPPLSFNDDPNKDDLLIDD